MASIFRSRIRSNSIKQNINASKWLVRSLYTDPGRPSIIHKRGSDLIHDPWYNKGTAFEITERDRLGLRGLLPPKPMTMADQTERFMDDFLRLSKRTFGSGDSQNLAKWRILNRLHDRNETLYYKILMENIREFAPIIYTPTVGEVCQNYSGLFRRPRGMYFSSEDRGEMLSMVYNWPAEEVDMIVVTDGSRILGLGDLGVQGIGIPIGKLDLYVAAAGFNPKRVLPIQIDVGTNNQKLLDDPLYLGLKHNRLDGEEYISIIDEFMEAVYTRWPKIIVQFEDFQNKWAFSLLKRYRNQYRMFNDDVQGTAGVALAGIMGAVRAQERPLEDLANLKIVVVGAGSAGLGVVNFVRQSMAKYLGENSIALNRAAKNFWIIDKDGLITQSRHNLNEDVKDFARPASESNGEGELKEGDKILDVVKFVNPDVLLGLSGVGGIFTKEILEAMKHGNVSRPAIFPMSNPTINSECSSADAFSMVGPNIIFASGSPFPDFKFDDGKEGHANQGNNMYLFPGIGLGTYLSGSLRISDGMLHAAAERLANYMTEEELKKGIIFPPTECIRQITREVAVAVIKASLDEGLADGFRDKTPKMLQQMTRKELSAYVQKHMWVPSYSPLIYNSPGL